MARMKIIDKMKKQRAVYWGLPTNDGFGGIQTAMPVEIGVRWEDKMEKIINTLGKEIVSRAVIYPDIVCDVGGFLWQGEMDTLEALNVDLSRPREIPGAYEIKARQGIPTLSAQQILEIVWL